MPLAPNQQLLEYHIVRILGQGAFGTVYLAHDTFLDGPVAIKELTITAQTDEVAFKRFLQEARAAGGLNHPHIVTVHALKVVEPNVYLVMEYLAGGSLRALLQKRGPLPAEEAVRIAADVCGGLAAAHAKGIIHRDVKAGNILLTEDGRAKVGDFGIAHVPRGAGGTYLSGLTATGFQPGTLIYMSPEQIRGQRVDGRSDVYQAGALLYEMLTGRHYVDLGALERRARETTGANVMLFQARLLELLNEAICMQEPEGVCQVRPEMPGWVREAVAAALAKGMEERPTAVELAEMLREGLTARANWLGSRSILRVGYVLTSAQQLEVFGRSGSKPEHEWQKLGSMPGEVEIPPGYDIGIKAQQMDNSALAILVQELADFGLIQWLDISYSREITDTGLVHLKALTDLTSLSLGGCTQITDAGLVHLKALTGLTSLGLWECIITDAGLAHLKALSGLTELGLGGCQQITDAGLAHLKALTSLARLGLMGCFLTDAGLAHLKALTGLTALSLAHNLFVTDAGLAHLKPLTSLAMLDLDWCEITDAGLAHLKALINLTHLSLSGCTRLTDAGLAHLKALVNLTHLSLSGCTQLTNAGLTHLKALTDLIELDVMGCYLITSHGLVHLRRPGLHIIVEDYPPDPYDVQVAEDLWKLIEGDFEEWEDPSDYIP